jgi:hypothetical protein
VRLKPAFEPSPIWPNGRPDEEQTTGELRDLLKNDFLRKYRSSKPSSQSVIQQHFVTLAVPDGTQFDASWAMQHKLEPTTDVASLELKFRHGKVILKQVFLSTQCKVNEISKTIQCTNVRRSGRHHAAGSWLIHRQLPNLSIRGNSICQEAGRVGESGNLHPTLPVWKTLSSLLSTIITVC